MPFQVRPVKQFLVRPALPAPLARLPELGLNLLWSWNHSIRAVFRRLDYPIWKASGYNPVVMLGRVSQETLERAAADPRYLALYRRAEQNTEEFWADVAQREVHWFEKWSQVLEWNPPFARWFVGAKTNVSYNCLDRHIATHRKNKIAILWEGESGEQRMISYQELHRLVSRFANVLKGRGLKAGDRAIIYMGMVPEVVVAMLACARVGAPHSVVFGGFAAESLRDRINDCGAKVVVTQDGKSKGIMLTTGLGVGPVPKTYVESKKLIFAIHEQLPGFDVKANLGAPDERIFSAPPIKPKKP